MKTVLYVEDDSYFLSITCAILSKHGYTVLTAESLAQARKWLANYKPDAIILDILLPDGNGLDYLKELRTQGNTVPVLLLTAWNNNNDEIQGFGAGADEYIGKPFNFDLLLIRLKKMIDHAERMPENIICGNLSLDIASAQAFINGANLMLTQKEFSLLSLFVQNEGKTVSPKFLFEKVWNMPMGGDDRTLKKHISSVRKRLNDGNCVYTINNRRGSGYCFEEI